MESQSGWSQLSTKLQESCEHMQTLGRESNSGISSVPCNHLLTPKAEVAAKAIAKAMISSMTNIFKA